MAPPPVLLPGKFHGQRNLTANYSPWGRKESDTTDQLTHRHGCKTFSLILITTTYYSSHIAIEVTVAEKNNFTNLPKVTQPNTVIEV